MMTISPTLDEEQDLSQEEQECLQTVNHHQDVEFGHCANNGSQDSPPYQDERPHFVKATSTAIDNEGNNPNHDQANRSSDSKSDDEETSKTGHEPTGWPASVNKDGKTESVNKDGKTKPLEGFHNVESAMAATAAVPKPGAYVVHGANSHLQTQEMLHTTTDESFVPKNEENVTFLVQEDDVQVVPIQAEPYHPTTSKNSDAMAMSADAQNKGKLEIIIMMIVLLMLIALSISIAILCKNGKMCHHNHNKNNVPLPATSSGMATIGNDTSIANNDTSYAANETTTPLIRRNVQQFSSRKELIIAVDKILNESFTSQDIEKHGEMADWDVSRIDDFSRLFSTQRNNDTSTLYFNDDISRWNISSATNTSQMFDGAFSFDGDLSKWDVANVIDMSYMFKGATEFRGIGIDQWDTSRVKNITGTFQYAALMDANLSRWDVSRVLDMSYAFCGAISFRGIGIDDWNTSSVTNMKSMFSHDSYSYTDDEISRDQLGTADMVFDANLSKWDVARVVDMSAMFAYANHFQGVGVENWNTGNVIDMMDMFYGASSFDANLSLWNVHNVTNMLELFCLAVQFQGIGVERWDISRVTTMSGMFMDAITFDADLSSWDVSNAIDVSYLFTNASSFKGRGIDRWNTSNLLYMQSMFDRATSFDANLSYWDVSRVYYMSSMFSDAILFQGNGINRWDTSNSSNFDRMFFGASNFDADLSGWDVSNAYYMDDMFHNAILFKGNGVDHWNTSNCRSMSNMFHSAILFDNNLSMWDVSSVYDMDFMFYNATSFLGRGLENWDVAPFISMESMFAYAASFNTNLSNWNVVYANINNIFDNATSFRGVDWYHPKDFLVDNVFDVAAGEPIVCNGTNFPTCYVPGECIFREANLDGQCLSLDIVDKCAQNYGQCPLPSFRALVDWTVISLPDIDANFMRNNRLEYKWVATNASDACNETLGTIITKGNWGFMFPYDCEIKCTEGCYVEGNTTITCTACM